MRKVTTILAMLRKRKELILFGILALVLLGGGCIAPPPAPFAPSNLAISVISPEQIDLKWNDNSLDEKGFYVYRKTVGDYSKIATLGPDVTSYSDRSLSPDSTYYYKVTAYNDGGESSSTREVSATTKKTAFKPFFDLSTPEGTLQSLVEAIWLGNEMQAAECWSDETPKFLVVLMMEMMQEVMWEETPWAEQMLKDPETIEFLRTIYKYEKKRIDENTFSVWIVMPGVIATTDDALTVVKEHGNWKIVFESLEDLREEETPSEEWDVDFYGERLTVLGSPEEAFQLYSYEGEWYVVPNEEDGRKKTDSSVYAYASFDPYLENELLIQISNDGRFPLDLDEKKDRYYVQTYGGMTYACDIDLDIGYGRVINPGDYEFFWVIYPDSVSDVDIRDIMIWLDKADMAIGLQKIPR